MSRSLFHLPRLKAKRISDIRTLPKLMGLIGFFALIAVAIAYLGITSLKSLSVATDTMAGRAEVARVASRLSAPIVGMNHAEFRLAAALEPKVIGETLAQIETERKALDEGIAFLKANVTGAALEALAKFDAEYRAYETALNSTLLMVKSLQTDQMAANAEIFKYGAEQSFGPSQQLRQAANEVTDLVVRGMKEASGEATREYQQASLLMVVIAGGGIAAAIALGWLLVALGIVRPIRAIVATLQQLAAGRYDVAIVGAERRDEVGDVAKTALVFLENGQQKQRLEAEQARAAEAQEEARQRGSAEREEARQRAAAERRELMNRMADEFETAVGGIVGTVSSAATQLQAAAQAMAATAEEATRQATLVATASEEATANVQTVATAAEELSASVQEIGRQAGQSSRMAERAVEEAGRTNTSVQSLVESAKKIGDVVQLINDIASQTNLLALNATIEAARAGEAGKGFAVVASEVKALANQTAKATDEIGSQIGAIQGSTRQSVGALEGITATIRELNHIAASIAAAVEQQGAATQEIARNVQQAAQGTMEVTSNIGGVTKSASDVGAASAQVLSSAHDLSTQATALRTEVDRFLQTIRQAA